MQFLLAMEDKTVMDNIKDVIVDILQHDDDREIKLKLADILQSVQPAQPVQTTTTPEPTLIEEETVVTENFETEAAQENDKANGHKRMKCDKTSSEKLSGLFATEVEASA